LFGSRLATSQPKRVPGIRLSTDRTTGASALTPGFAVPSFLFGSPRGGWSTSLGWFGSAKPERRSLERMISTLPPYSGKTAGVKAEISCHRVTPLSVEVIDLSTNILSYLYGVVKYFELMHGWASGTMLELFACII
jgi:hypothetical protein